MGIVKQLGGTISVRSLLGKGTEVEIRLPMTDADLTSERDPRQNSDARDISTGVQEVQELRRLASGKTAAVHRPSPPLPGMANTQTLLLDGLERYLVDWYGFHIATFRDWAEQPDADVTVALRQSIPDMKDFSSRNGKETRTLLITSSSMTRKNLPHSFEYVSQPFGPYKLASHLLPLLQKEAAFNQSDKTPDSNAVVNDERAEPSQAVGSESSTSNLVNHALAQHFRTLRHDPESHVKSSHTPTLLSSLSSPTPNGDKSTALSKQLTTAEESSHETIPPKGLHILAVDDNEINLQLLRRFLAKRADDLVDSAHDGYEAVAAVENSPDPYDVIFMDISMPGMDGFEATRRVRQLEGGDTEGSKRRAYVVALTGLGSSRDREEAVKCGFDDFLMKPAPFAKVRRLLEQRGEKMGG